MITVNEHLEKEVKKLIDDALVHFFASLCPTKSRQKKATYEISSVMLLAVRLKKKNMGTLIR